MLVVAGEEGEREREKELVNTILFGWERRRWVWGIELPITCFRRDFVLMTFM